MRDLRELIEKSKAIECPFDEYDTDNWEQGYKAGFESFRAKMIVLIAEEGLKEMERKHDRIRSL